MSLHHFVEIINLTCTIGHVQLTQQNVATVRKYTVSREVVDSHTAGIFIQDTAYFHSDSLNFKSKFIE